MGVPLIVPVVVLKLIPAGNAGDKAYEGAPYPPVATTGTNGLKFTFMLNSWLGYVTVVLIGLGLDTLNLNLAEPNCGCASVTVTVNSESDNDAVAFPEIVPVTVLNVNPAGNAGLTEYV